MTDHNLDPIAASRRLPAAFVDQARRFHQESATPVEPRQAATVMMLRDRPSADGIDVYMIRRAASMAFAAGLYAFPGGGKDPQDIDVRATAVREMTEETGVRLTEPVAWSRWITPEFEPRRYDTWFYVARQPTGQTPRDISGEASWAGWLDPAGALRDHGDRMLPPTAVTLTELAEHRSVAQVLESAARRDLTPVRPRLRWDVEPPRLVLPGDEDY